jgi:hypothetical protein
MSESWVSGDAVQLIRPSETERVKVWPGSAVSNEIIVERLDGTIITKAQYRDIVSLDISRKRVRLAPPGELLFFGVPNGSSEKSYELCVKVSDQSRKLTYCFVSENAACSVGKFCREGSDGGASVQQLADDLKRHLHPH